MASGPPSTLPPTSLVPVPASDRQTTFNAARITESGIESACAAAAIAAGAQLSKEFIHGDISSRKVQEQMKSESEELTVRKQEKYDIHEQGTSS